MKKYLVTVFTLASCVALSACMSANIQEAGIYRPIAGNALSPEAVTLVAPMYTITAHQVVRPDGAILNGVLLTQPGAHATVLFFGGNAFTLERAPSTAALFASLGVNVMMFDTRGCGTSAAGGGAPRIKLLMDDGDAIFDYMTSLPNLADQKFVVHGHSLGSFVAGHVAANRHANGVVLQSSATTTEDFAHGSIPGAMRPFVNLKIEEGLQGQGNLQNMAAIDEALLIIVGEKDRQTKPAMSTALYRASPLPEARKILSIVKGAGHNDVFAFQEGRDAYRALLDLL